MDDPWNTPPEEPTPSRLGKGMVAAAWVLILILLTSLFSHWLEEEANPNRELVTQVDEGGGKAVVLKRNRHGHYLVTGRINGHPVDFLVDTGATYVSIPRPLAERLGIRRGRPVTVQTANGSILVYTAVLDEVAVGGIAVRRVRAIINPYAQEALLGMSFLRHLEFTQRGNTLTLRQLP